MHMYTLEEITETFTKQSRQILDDRLVGIYLHGSAVMGCFSPDKSDVDLLVVVNSTVPDDIKKRYMDMVTELSSEAPAKGIEMSIIRESDCDPFVYPTPFELHFSIAHLEWYRNDPDDYISKMKGTDKDLAAHVTITRHRGRTLYGKPIEAVFGEVSEDNYFDSILCDIENAVEDIENDPMYIVLNLARVLAYKNEKMVLSKKEGGEWGINALPVVYGPVLEMALDEYCNNEAPHYDSGSLREYAKYMINEIKRP